MIRRTITCAAAALALVGASASPAAADNIRDKQWYLTDLNVAEVHQSTRGAGVKVAVLDTGVDAKHPDLAGAVLPGYSTFDDEWTDKTGREDLVGHGTAMAGIIAGRGHKNGAGILGIAPEAKILPISAPIDMMADASFMTKAIDFAIQQHAGVINMSFGKADSQVMHDAIKKAQAADIVLVAATGNRGQAGGDYPGRYPEVLTVGAHQEGGKIADLTVTGPHVDLSAPGEKITVAGVNDSGYQTVSGTSPATAMVSGAAALLRAKFPDMSAAEVVHRLTATADDAGAPGRDDTYGYGRLNILAALTADVAPLPVAATPTAAASQPAAAAPDQNSALDSELPKANNLLGPLLLVGVFVLLAVFVLIPILIWRRRRT